MRSIEFIFLDFWTKSQTTSSRISFIISQSQINVKYKSIKKILRIYCLFSFLLLWKFLSDKMLMPEYDLSSSFFSLMLSTSTANIFVYHIRIRTKNVKRRGKNIDFFPIGQQNN